MVSKQVSFDEDEAGISAYHMTVADFIDMMEYTFNPGQKIDMVLTRLRTYAVYPRSG